MVRNSKWIDGLAADATVRSAAVCTLRARLRAVRELLPEAVRSEQPGRAAGDACELVHQLRVATRRAAAAIQLYRPLIPRRDRKWFRRRLRDIRQAAGRVRDLDVLLLNRHTTDELPPDLLTRLGESRSEALGPLRSLNRDLEQGERLRRRSRRLIHKVRRRDEPIGERSLADWGAARLRREAERFFAAAPADLHDVEALHRFRVRGKRLRYALELLAPAFPDHMKTETYPLVVELQDRLGKIHDCDVAANRFLDWAAATAEPADAERLRTAARRQCRARERLVTEFAAWWAPTQSARLVDQLEHCICIDATPDVASASIPILRVAH